MNIKNIYRNHETLRVLNKARKTVKRTLPKNLTIGKVVDTLELSVKKNSKNIKKVSLGAASAILPGLGQFINGEYIKALNLFCLYAATAAAPLSLGLFPAFLNLVTQIYSGADAMRKAK